jgi:hypothetical protein
MAAETIVRERPSGAPPGRHRPGLARIALAALLLLLAAGMAAVSVLGPVGLDVLQHRTSDTTLNQLRGGDAAALLVVAPLTVVAAVLARRRHPAAPLLATGIGAFAVYTYAQVVIGQEYLDLPGNVERFFPLLLAVFVTAEACLVLGWRAVPRDLPALSPVLRRTTGVALLAVAAFLVLGLHLRSMVTAWTDPTALTEYASSPTPFWLVKLMDLGVVVPLALATGVGVLRASDRAVRVMYPLLTAYTCLAASVAAMAVVMAVRDDPDASAVLVTGFAGFALLFAALTAAAYRPLFRQPSEGDRQ